MYLAALIPLNVLYHEVRHAADGSVDDDARLVSELRPLKAEIGHDRITLIEPAGISKFEHRRRLFLAQLTLAPVLVTRRNDAPARLVNKRALPTPAPPGAPQSTRYVFVEE